MRKLSENCTEVYLESWTAGLQVSSYYVFEHGTLSTRLAANYYYLGQINGVLYTDCRKNILQLVHQPARIVSFPAQKQWGDWDSGGTNVMRPGSEMPPACEAMSGAVVEIIGARSILQ